MLKLWQLQDQLYSLTKKDGCIISPQYGIGGEYNYEKDGKFIKVILKNTYIKNGKKGQIKKSILNRTFSNLLKDLEVEIIKPPVLREIGYDNSLEMLYNHYPYGENNNTNCVFVNYSGQVLAVQYNGLANTSFIITDVTAIPNYIVLNNSKKLRGEFYKKDYEYLEQCFKILFNNL